MGGTHISKGNRLEKTRKQNKVKTPQGKQKNRQR
jgi:hypothetical protein